MQHLPRRNLSFVFCVLGHMYSNVHSNTFCNSKRTVICYCVTNHHTPKGLKQHLLSHIFCCSRVQGWLSWVLCLRVSHKAAIKLLTRGVVLSEGLTGEGLTSKFIWLLTESSFLWTVGVRASVSCWLLAGGCPHFLVTQQGRELDASKVEVIVLSNAITEVTSITSVIFYIFEISH